MHRRASRKGLRKNKLDSANSSDYFEVYVSDIARELEDDVTVYLFEIGALGVSEKLDFEQPDVRFNPTLKPKKTVHLVGYFDLSQNPLRIREAIQNKFPQASVIVVREQAKDWLEEWKKGYEPFSLCDGDIWVVPSWRPVPAEAKIPLFIDPGMAFGTGTHETTQICSQLITQVLKEKKINRAFDIGTGTGILAMVMAKLGVSEIGQSDIDLECKRVSLENLALNKITNVDWYEDIKSYSGELDLIVANIIDGVLLELQPEIKAAAGKETQILLSGILLEREKEFLADFTKNWPLKVRQRIAMKEWVGFWLQ